MKQAQTLVIHVSVCVLAFSFSSAAGADGPLGPGDHWRSIELDGRTRSYLVHVPPKSDSKRSAPLVLAFHGAMTNASIMAFASDLSTKADKAGFVVAYPNGTGKGDMLLVWNSGGIRGPADAHLPDDVKFTERLLDDLARVVKIDRKRVYATGMSNGGMMCYRLAAELSDRIAAIAPVSGTMAVDGCRPQFPVPVIHFHGTADKLVPFEGFDRQAGGVVPFKSVDETIRTWVRIDGCPGRPKTVQIPDTAHDGSTVEEMIYGPGRNGAEVVLFKVKDGGHTWPGRPWPVPWLGKTTSNISANDLMWEFFQRHPKR
jgi:polyhydroxybutyrate depolymerase